MVENTPRPTEEIRDEEITFPERKTPPSPRCRTFEQNTFARCALQVGHKGECKFEHRKVQE